MSGTWGDTVNNGITSLIETSLAGYTSIAMTDANYTLSQANGAADEARSMMINMTGTLTANRNVVCPNVNKMYVFRNSTTGGFSLVLKTSGGTGVTVPAGKTITVFCDGADNIFDATSYFSGAITVNGAFTTNSTITGGSTTTTGVFSAPLGSVGAPSYTFTGDTNTGTWSPGADTLAWSTNGAERMRIDASGNLNVGSATNDFGGVIFGKKSAGVASVDVFAASTSEAKLQLLNNNNSAAIGNGAGGELRFYASDRNAERMRIDASGNVGIGITPSTKVDISVAGGMLRIGSGSGNNQLQAYSSGGTLGLWAGGASQVYSNGGLSFLVGATTGTGVPSGGTTAVTIDSSGNVGIGVTPGSRLDVAGGLVRNSYAEAFRIANDGGYLSGFNSAQSVRTGYLQFNAGSDVFLTTESTLALRFGTNGAERMRIDSSGNVGIGVTPSVKFEVAGGANVVAIRSASDAGSALLYTVNLNASAAQWYVGHNGADVDTGNLRSGALKLFTNSAERMRIDASGNVGIGTGNPSGFGNTGKFAVLTASSTGGVVATFANSGSTGAAIQLFQSGVDTATIGMPAGVGGVTFLTGANERMRIDSSGNLNVGSATNDFGGVIYAKKTSGNATIDIYAQSSAEAKIQLLNNSSSGAIGCGSGGELRFYASDRNAERMRIDSSGRVGIGKTPTTYALEINGDAQATNFRGAVIGNADTATILQTARTINGVSFNGSANITVTAAAGTLTGATLASGVTGSSLTSVASGCTDGTNELGYKDIPRTTGGLARGQAYATAAGFTVNTGSAAGSAYSVYNDSAAAFTITQGSGLTLRQGGTTNTGNRTLAARGFATIWFNSTTEAIISGSGIT